MRVLGEMATKSNIALGSNHTENKWRTELNEGKYEVLFCVCVFYKYYKNNINVCLMFFCHLIAFL